MPILGAKATMFGGGWIGPRGDAPDWSDPFETPLNDSNSGANQWFGWATDVDSDTVAVGSPGQFFGGVYAGKVFVYKKTSGIWSLQATLQPSNSVAGDGFGCSLALQGDTLAVGSYLGPTSGSDRNQGRVTVFVRSGSTWSQQQIISAPSAGEYYYFGFHVSLDVGSSSDESLLIGEYGRDHTNPNTGANQNHAGSAHVYTRSGSTWSHQQEIDFGESGYLTTRQEASLGTATAIKGDWAAVHNMNYTWGDGASGGAGTGCVFMYKRTGTNWAYTQTLVGADSDNDDSFGYDIHFSGDPADTLICGMNGGSNYTGPGFSYVYTRTGNTWTSKAKLQADDYVNDDGHGRVVALNEAGNVALVGSPYDAVTGYSQRGAVYLWTTTDSTKTNWTQVKKLVPPTPYNNQMRYGMNSTKISGDTIVVPAYGTTINGNANAGKVYIYDRVITGTYTFGEYISDSGISISQWRNTSDSTTSNNQLYIRMYLSQGTALQSTLRSIFENMSTGDTIVVTSPFSQTLTISGTGITSSVSGSYKDFYFDVNESTGSSQYFYQANVTV